MKAIILAGGFGTRLKEVIRDVPKPMAMIAGKPFLEHQIHTLKEQDITDIILAVHYMPEKIKSYFGDGRRFGVDITYSEEEIPLGTAGAIKRAERYIDDTFFVLNGDSYSKINLEKFLDFHKAKRSTATISLTKIKDSSQYGSVILKENKISNFNEKTELGEGLINSGVYIFEPIIFDSINADKQISLEKEIFPKLVQENKLYGYVYDDYFMDIGRPETYFQFRKDILEDLVMHPEDTVRGAMNKISQNGIDFILINNKQQKFFGVANNRILKEYLLKGGNLEDELKIAAIHDPIIAKTDDEECKISELLMSGINHLPIIDQEGRVTDVKFRVEDIKSEVFPVIRGKAPLRISFAGGGTDVAHFFEKYGGVVINATIDKYCHATIMKRADSKIIINSDMKTEETILDCNKKLIYDGKFDIIKSVVNILKPGCGFEINFHNDIPPGRGLGSSASFAVLLIKILSELKGMKYGDDKIADIAYKVEHEELGIKGGWQDQYAAVTGGFNWMEFNGDKTLIYPLRLKEEVIEELNSRLLLCYVGAEHFSGDLHKKQEKSFLEDENAVANRLNNLKRIAIDIKDCLLLNNPEKIGTFLHESWMNKKSVTKEISNKKIDELYETGITNGADGGKLLGAGGGGYILFSYSPKKRNTLVKALEDKEGEILNFNFEFKGTRTWTVKE